MALPVRTCGTRKNSASSMNWPARTCSCMVAIALGAEDFIANIKTNRTKYGIELYYCREQILMNYKELPRDVKPGDHILLSDGLVNLEVTRVDGEDIHTVILNSGKMSDRKRVAVPGVAINLPAVSETDQADIEFGINMDYIAASFIQRGEDVVTIRKILEKHDNRMQIISKIECQEAVKNIDDIIKMSDGIMVARGDLGVEVPAEEVPMLQKLLIKKCQIAGKPVITATQMLESMCANPRPTRAETSDVANAILDGTDAIMK